MGNVSALVKALLTVVVLLAGISGCTPSPSPDEPTSPSASQSVPSTPVTTPSPTPNPMATLNGLSVYVASTGVEILDQNLIAASRSYEVTIPDDVTQIAFAVMCQSVNQGWTVSVDDNELSWTSPDECPTRAIFSDLIDVAPSSVVTVQVGLDADTYLAIVTYSVNS